MLKESGFFKNRKIIALLCLEALLILLGVAGLFGKTGVVAGREETDRLLTEGISLPAGVYQLRLYYEAEGSGLGDFGVRADNVGYKTLLANDIPLYAGAGERECEFFLRGHVENLKAVLNVSEEVEVKGLELIATNKGSRIRLFWVLLFSLFLDIFLVLLLYERAQPIPLEKKLVIFGIPALTLLASLPVMVDYNMIGADLVFHMQRIEALAQAIGRGELGVRIESMWLAGHGYANSIFYGDTCLVIPALLRILGLPMDSVYRLFVVLVNLATAWISYLSFSGCFQNKTIGMFGCSLYTLAPYRLYNIYNRAAVGEYTAMIFLPLLIWGFYRIYTEDEHKKGYLWNWVIPVIGFSGIIQSHALSCELAGGFVVLLCLIMWKKTFRKRTFLVLLCTVVMTIAVNAWYLVPFLDMMQADSYCFGNQANVLIQSRGILPAQIFYTLQAGGGSSRFAENGMLDTEPIGLGAALLLCLILWPVLCARRGKADLSEVQRRERKAGNLAFGMTLFALFMSTCYFPWDFLSSCNRLFATLIGSLQFPTRITTVVTILGVFCACVAGMWILRENNFLFSGRTALFILVFVSMIFGSYQLNDILLTRDQFLRLYSAQNVGTTAVLGAEYLPVGVDLSHMTYHAPVLSEGVSMKDYKKDGLSVTAVLEYPGDGLAAMESVRADSGAGNLAAGEMTTGYAEFPMLYYKGYRAKESESGESLAVVKGDNGDVRVLLPEGFAGTVRVWYAGMWYWRLAEAVSMLTGIGFLGYWLLRKQNLHFPGIKAIMKKV